MASVVKGLSLATSGGGLSLGTSTLPAELPTSFSYWRPDRVVYMLSEVRCHTCLEFCGQVRIGRQDMSTTRLAGEIFTRRRALGQKGARMQTQVGQW